MDGLTRRTLHSVLLTFSDFDFSVSSFVFFGAFSSAVRFPKGLILRIDQSSAVLWFWKTVARRNENKATVDNARKVTISVSSG